MNEVCDSYVDLGFRLKVKKHNVINRDDVNDDEEALI